MNWPILWMILMIMAAGALGGFINALMSDNQFALPTWVREDGRPVAWMPGALGNMAIGGVASVISWGLYGPFATAMLFSMAADTAMAGAGHPPGLSVAGLVGGVLVGVGGARWLTNEVDKTLLRRTAVKAAETQADHAVSQTIALAKPREALFASQGLANPQA